MREQEALEVLESLKPDVPDVLVTTGVKGTRAFLLLKNTHATQRWAVIYTPGDRYFSVDTNTPYSRDYVDEGVPDDEVRDILERFTRIGVAYVRGAGEVVRVGFFKTPVLVVQVGDKREELRLSVFGTIASIFKPSMGTIASSE